MLIYSQYCCLKHIHYVCQAFHAFFCFLRCLLVFKSPLNSNIYLFTNPLTTTTTNNNNNNHNNNITTNITTKIELKHVNIYYTWQKADSH